MDADVFCRVCESSEGLTERLVTRCFAAYTELSWTPVFMLEMSVDSCVYVESLYPLRPFLPP